MYKYGAVPGLLRLVLPIALCLNAYLYLYPVFHGCVFPTTDASATTAFTDTFKQHLSSSPRPESEYDKSRAPFRLLALADPQIEGDSSLPKPEDAFVPKLKRHWERLSSEREKERYPLALETVREIILQDIPHALKALRKQIDLFGNDHYLGHIFRTLRWWTKPTHVAVLGDLIGSQWVNDEEFEWRGWRYWNRVFAGGRRVEDSITILDSKEEEREFDLGDRSWTDRIINIAGNHDIGYAGEISHARVERFERVFGTANWDVRFSYAANNDSNAVSDAVAQPSVHLIVLNSLILDTPALSDDLRSETFEYLGGLLSHRLRPVEDRSTFTLLLTHLPLHKKEGTCVDSPFFDYWPNDDGGGVYKPHGLREQNHLSEQASRQGTLQGLFGMSGDLDAPAEGKGRNGLILTGHDHEGCDIWHFIPSESVWSASETQNEDRKETSWEVSKWAQANQTASHTGVREITLRSMMGDYGGNAGLLSAWFSHNEGEWKYNIQTCGLNLKVWWTVQVTDLIVLCLGIIALATRRPVVKSQSDRQRHARPSKAADAK